MIKFAQGNRNLCPEGVEVIIPHLIEATSRTYRTLITN